jgi:hypothetical protein
MTKRIALLKSLHAFRLKELEKADAIRAEKIAPHIAALSRRINRKPKRTQQVTQTQIFPTKHETDLSPLQKVGGLPERNVCHGKRYEWTRSNSKGG